VVYGKSVKHQPQRVGLAHELADEDISKTPSSLTGCLRLTLDQSPLSNGRSIISNGSRIPLIRRLARMDG
jgi:hypothetical protein